MDAAILAGHAECKGVEDCADVGAVGGASICNRYHSIYCISLA